ncbi:ABC transporter ATP-binding protein [Deinococcus malanensis]|uniref:ABC transporter ATP-binding protein n=1 Tax=Deinococcus malanensis TaxID=1706855 RepID=A0ABQ2F0W3_9DEIO|nr:ABC transporter ATP-binding protein [Deinococcus malanensis]GGK38897.1 ABC transporter ATP-binding protein [Deinococcus malanensis]
MLSASPVLSVRDLRLSFHQRPVVHNVTFDLYPGERVCLLGPSGSGKSLTARAVLGLLPATAAAHGHITVLNHDVSTIPAARRAPATRLSYVAQDTFTALNPLVSIGAQLQRPFQQQGLSTRAARQAAAELLERLHLPDPHSLLRRSPAELSGGQRQRICLALAFACRTPLLIADEPTTALDTITQARTLDLLRQHTGHPAAPALLFITHDLTAAAHVCTRALVMDRGTIVERGPLPDLLATPQHPLTREMVTLSVAATRTLPVRSVQRAVPA